MNTCVSCGEIIPEGRQICYSCERGIVKVGTILQSYDEYEENYKKDNPEQESENK